MTVRCAVLGAGRIGQVQTLGFRRHDEAEQPTEQEEPATRIGFLIGGNAGGQGCGKRHTYPNDLQVCCHKARCCIFGKG